MLSLQLVNCLRIRSYGLCGGGRSLELALRFQKPMPNNPSPSPNSIFPSLWLLPIDQDVKLQDRAYLLPSMMIMD